MSEYFDFEGKPATLNKMVRIEPEWAEARIKAGEIAIKERDTYRELCVELLKAAQDYLPHMPESTVNEGGANKHSKMLHTSDALKLAITKAEQLLGDKNAT